MMLAKTDDDYSDARIENLPKWAQMLVHRLRSDCAGLRRDIQVLNNPDSDLIVTDLIKSVGIPIDWHFKLNDQKDWTRQVSARVTKNRDGFLIMGGDQIVIQPLSSNTVEIYPAACTVRRVLA